MATEPDQQQMDCGPGITPGPYPSAVRFQPPCGDVGPYVWERYTPGGRKTYVAMKCNRPARHGGHHQWADPTVAVHFLWATDGKAVHPLPISAR